MSPRRSHLAAISSLYFAAPPTSGERMSHRRKALPVVFAVAALAAPAVARADTTLTFKEVDKGATFAFIDNPPKSKHHRASAGDQFIVTTPLVDNAGKHIGRLQAQ